MCECVVGVKMGWDFEKVLMNSYVLVITQRWGGSGFLVWDAWEFRLMPFWLSMEDVRLVSFKDRVDVSSCLTQFIMQPLDPCVWQGLSLNLTS